MVKGRKRGLLGGSLLFLLIRAGNLVESFRGAVAPVLSKVRMSKVGEWRQNGHIVRAEEGEE